MTDSVDRDQLAHLLRGHGWPGRDDDYPGDEYDCCADAIIAAGWRLPVRMLPQVGDLITEARQFASSIPEGIGDLRSLDATRLARARTVVGDLADELEAARARIAELAQQSDPKAVERFDALIRLLDRCRATTTSAFAPDDHRAVWCVLPNGHAGMHHGELPQDGADFPMIVDWAEVE